MWKKHTHTRFLSYTHKFKKKSSFFSLTTTTMQGPVLGLSLESRRLEGDQGRSRRRRRNKSNCGCSGGGGTRQHRRAASKQQHSLAGGRAGRALRRPVSLRGVLRRRLALSLFRCVPTPAVARAQLSRPSAYPDQTTPPSEGGGRRLLLGGV